MDRVQLHGLLVRRTAWVAITACPLALLDSCASSTVPPALAHSAHASTSSASGADPAGFAQMFPSLWLRTDSADKRCADQRAAAVRGDVLDQVRECSPPATMA